MTFLRGRSLVPTVARVVQLTGVQDLRNLEKPTGELKLEELLLTASDGIFDRLVAEGVDPASGMAHLTGFNVDVRPAAGPQDPKSWSGLPS